MSDGTPRGSGTDMVSVVIPCYRQANFLSEAIESVLDQSYRHVEIIVIDDGSPDHTRTVASSYPAVRYHRQENQGLPSARNTGFRMSTGDKVVFLDADDRLLPDALRIGVETIHSFPNAAFVYGQCQVIDRKGKTTALSSPLVTATGDVYRSLFKENHIWTPGMVMFRRKTVDAFGGFDESLLRGAEDIDLYLRVTKQRSIHCHEKTVLQYRRHRNSISADKARMIDAKMELYRKHQADAQNDPELTEVCRRAFQPSLYNSLIRISFMRHPLSQRIMYAIRFRTRLRAIASFFRGMRGAGQEQQDQCFHTSRKTRCFRSGRAINTIVTGMTTDEIPPTTNRSDGSVK